MLREIAVRDFALVDDLRLALGAGLNVLTGETGAGKSILVDAIALAVGERASSDSVRTGRERTVVEAVFDVGSLVGVDALLAEMGVEGTGELVVRREIARTGPNRCFMNGTASTLAMLKRAGDRIVDIHGQHEHQLLLHPERHVDFLDSYLGLLGKRDAYRDALREWRQRREELARMRAGLASSEERIDYLRYACQELDRAGLTPGEDENLEAERRVLANSEKLVLAASGAAEALSEGDTTALDLLSRARRSLEEAGRVDPQLRVLAEELDTAIAHAEDVARSLGTYGDGIEHGPERLEEINNRLSLLERLKRRYRTTLDEVISRHGEMKAELGSLENSESTLGDLEEKLRSAQSQVVKRGRDLMGRRQRGTSRLSTEVVAVLKELEMQDARFEVRMDVGESDREEDLMARADENGLERIEFLISSNVGEPPKPLARIASGGEMSRIMLALKTALVESDPVGTLIFDEIDIGIGGQAARTLGEKLKELGRARQVLCVTHLPQIAGMADRHYVAEKRNRLGRTWTEVRLLEDEERVEEVARMIAGKRPTPTAIEHARELIM
ncbi:MAG: DNA repair protein RecN [Candidatus Eisenbacteria sp.]|nr:DNA repair protein RecN [Candidatus Eisenbacteria bacterium]